MKHEMEDCIHSELPLNMLIPIRYDILLAVVLAIQWLGISHTAHKQASSTLPTRTEASPDRWKFVQHAFARGMGYIWEVVQRLRYETTSAFSSHSPLFYSALSRI
jgi:hypothetical protein